MYRMTIMMISTAYSIHREILAVRDIFRKCITRILVTDHISVGDNAIASVRPFVSTLSSEPTDR